jgi:hypothetical protein
MQWHVATGMDSATGPPGHCASGLQYRTCLYCHQVDTLHLLPHVFGGLHTSYGTPYSTPVHPCCRLQKLKRMRGSLHFIGLAPQAKHTVFVGSAEEAAAFRPDEYFDTPK